MRSTNDGYDSSAILAGLTEAEIASYRNDVVTVINNETVARSDLAVTVPRLLESARHEAREARRGIRSVAAAQIAALRRAHTTLRGSHDRIEQLRDNFTAMGKAVTDMGTAGSYAHMRRLHFFHRNVSSIVQWTENLKRVHYINFGQQLEELRIAEVYEHVKAMEGIRQRVFAPGSRHQNVFAPYFEKQKVVNMLFINKVLEMFKGAVSACIQEALREEGEPLIDEFEALKAAVTVCASEKAAPVIRSLEAQALDEDDPDLASAFDSVSSFGADSIRQALRESVDIFWADEILKDNPDISQNVSAMEGIEPVLSTLETVLLPLSSKFPVFQCFARAVDDKVMDVLRLFADPKSGLEAHVLVQCMNTGAWYKGMMAQWGFTQYLTAPKSIDGVIVSILACAVGGMKEHMTNRARGCAITICKAQEYSEKPSGTLYTSGPVDLFVILQQSLASITGSVDRGVMEQLGVACVSSVHTYIQGCRDAASFEEWEDANDELPTPLPQATWMEARVRQLCAFCNDLLNVAQNIETVEAKFVGVWSVAKADSDSDDDGEAEQRAMSAAKRKKAALNGKLRESPFVALGEEVASECPNFYLGELAQHLMRVTASAWDKLFLPGDWYLRASNPLTIICDTAIEYVEQDFSVLLEAPMPAKLLPRLLEAITIAYLERLLTFLKDIKLSEKFDVAKFAACVDRDIYALNDTWVPRFSERPESGGPHAVEAATMAIRVAHEFLVMQPDQAATIMQHHVMDEFGDCPSFLPTIIIDKRSDLDRKGREALAALWRTAIAPQARNADDEPTTGWAPTRRTILRRLDPSIGDVEKKGFFSRGKSSDDKKKAKLKAEKEEKAKRRQAREEKKRAAAEKAASSRTAHGSQKKNAEADVEDLAAVLGGL